MNRPEEWRLFEELENETISSEDFNYLQNRLVEDPEVLKAYIAYNDMSHALENLSDSSADEAWEGEWEKVTTENTKVTRFPILLWTAVAACAILIFVLSLPKKQTDDVAVAEIPMETGLARITMAANVKWDGEVFDNGSYLNDQLVKLKAGFLNLEFDNGAEVVIEGPAEFQIVNEMNMQVKAGKLRANIPESAHGFTIKTEQLDVVDLGTEFGVEVTDGKMNVQVFDGEVKLVKENRDLRSMTAGQSVSVEASEVKEAEFVSEKFKNKDELILITRGLKNKAYVRWMDYAKGLQDHPDLMAYYYFFNERRWGFTLPNKKANASIDSFGEARATTRVPGRFTTDKISMNNSAFLFNRVNSRVKINLPERVPELTMMCWLNIESTDKSYSTILQSHKRSKGTPGWFLLSSGRMLFNLTRPDGIVRPLDFDHSFVSPKVWDPGMRGIWFHLAVSINKNTITFFRNGRQIKEITNRVKYDSLEIGEAELGNLYRDALKRGKAQNLHGLMDEFLIFKRALGLEEIREIYNQGNIE